MCVLTFEMTLSVFELLMDPRFKRSVSGNPSLESFIIAFAENPFTKNKFPEALHKSSTQRVERLKFITFSGKPCTYFTCRNINNPLNFL